VAVSLERKPVRRAAQALVLCGLLAASPGRANIGVPSTDPESFVLSAGGNLYVGNATRIPGPVAANGSLLLDERVAVTAAVARRDLKLRLLASVEGDALSVDGAAQLSNQARVKGSLTAERGVIVGVTARVDGDVVATAGGVRIVRLASVFGDVYADGEFKGDRDVRVGSPGSRVEVRGDAIIRDRSEYFGAIAYEGALSVLGTGLPVFHAGVVGLSPGTLAAPGMPAWKLSPLTVRSADPGPVDVTISKESAVTTLPPGRYGVLALGQEARLVLSAGVYDFEQVIAQSDARMRIELPAAADTIELRVRRDLRPGRRVAMDLGTNDAALRRDRAARVRTLVGGSFRGDQDVVWAGSILAGKDIVLGKHTTLRGAAWSKGNLQMARDAVVEWVPLSAGD